MEQACEILQLTRRQLMRRIQKGEYTCPPKFGRDYQISPEWIRDVLKDREHELVRDQVILKLHKEAQAMRERVATASGFDT